MNWAAANRKPVQRDGAYSVRDNERPRTRKDAVGKFSKYKDEWVVCVVDGHSIPEDRVIPVTKADGSSKLVKLLKYKGSKRLDHAKIEFYGFENISDWIGQRA